METKTDKNEKHYITIERCTGGWVVRCNEYSSTDKYNGSVVTTSPHDTHNAVSQMLAELVPLP